MSFEFRACTLDQPLLLAPSLQQWLPEGHLARFIADVTEQLDLSAIYSAYDRRDGRGQAGYHPLLMIRLLLYGYCVGVASSRAIERKTFGRRKRSRPGKSRAGELLRFPTPQRPNRNLRRSGISPIRKVGLCRMERTRGVSCRPTMLKRRWIARHKSSWRRRSRNKATTNSSVPMLQQVIENVNSKPQTASADTG